MAADHAVPEPPEFAKPLTTTWKAGRRLCRVHPNALDPRRFNPGIRTRRGRFHPIKDAVRNLIPTLYAADKIDGALSETVFHNVVAGGVILRAELATRSITRIDLVRDIVVADLRGHGLRKLKLKRTQLLECEAVHYSDSARWAEAIHASNPDLNGMIWILRQFDKSTALLAFGDRLNETDFVEHGPPEPLDRGRRYRDVQRAASTADIVVVEG